MSTKTIKQMLIDLYTEDREAMRCKAVENLKAEAKKVSAGYKLKITKKEDDIAKLNHEIYIIRDEIRTIKQANEQILKDKRLYHFSKNVCGEAIHDTIIAFDLETNKHIREILEG